MPKSKRTRARKRTSGARRALAVGMIGALALLSALVAGITQRNLTFEPLASARAQDHDHSNHASGQTLEPLLDGSVEPQLIPDDVAIRALLSTLRVPPDPDAATLEQLHTRISKANLSNADIEILARELGRLDTQAKSQEARIEAFRPTPTAGRVAVDRYLEQREILNALFVESYQQLLASLSPEGAAKLQAHLLHVKSRIKVFPTPDMSAKN